MAWFEAVATSTSIGVGGGAGFFTLKFLLEWLGGRLDKKADRIDENIQMLISNLQAQINQLNEREVFHQKQIRELQTGLQECRTKHAESDAKVLQLQTLLNGTCPLVGDVK